MKKINPTLNLTLDEQKRLVKGKGAWQTAEIQGKSPALWMSDGPHGVRKPRKEGFSDINDSVPATCFPTESALSCSWDPELVQKMANAIAKEAAANDVSMILGCGVNIKRSPLCGRNFEYFSEDPLLAGILGTAYVNEMQKNGIGTSVKHFAGNNQETNRMTSNSSIDERALREIYLRAFEIIVKNSQPTSLMASYNMLNGLHSCENKKLLTDILRDEWGFKGLVVSDWGASIDLDKSVAAGMDLEMPENPTHTVSDNGDKVALERASAKVQELSTNWILTDEKKSKILGEKSQVDFDEHNKIACEILCESAVLLKNDGILPLGDENQTKKIVIVGEMAEKMRFQGGGSSHINATHQPNAVEAFKKAGYEVIFARGYNAENDLADSVLESEAIEKIKAESAETPVLFFGGLPDNFEGEGYDRTTLAIPKNQLDLIEKIHEANKNLIFVNMSGSAVEMPFTQKARAILTLYLGGQASDEAVVSLISGKSNPCGKLSETFPLSLKDVPCNEWFGTPSANVEYRESIFTGYRYYDTYKKEVLYPFGHGLSYTSFEYSEASFDGKSVTFTLKNTGNFDGKEVAQVYVKNPECDFLREEKSLRGFAKIFLKSGEQKKVTIPLDENSFKIFNAEKGGWTTVAGEYEILIGSSSRDIRLSVKAAVEGEKIARNDRETLSEYFSQQGERFHISREQFEKLYGSPLPDFDHVKKGEFSAYYSLEQLAKKSLIAKITMTVACKAIIKSMGSKSKDDPSVVMSVMMIKQGSLEGISGMSGGQFPQKVKEAIILDANGKKLKALIRLMKK